MIPIIEAMGRGLLGTPLMSTILAAELIRRAGGVTSEAYLSQIAKGATATVALLETGDWGGEHQYVSLDSSERLSGEKRFVSDASVSDWFVVYAREASEPVLVLVPASALSENSIKANALIDLTKRAATVDFSGAEAHSVIRGRGIASALRDYYLLGSLLVAAEASGTLATCLASIVDYLNTRKQFDRPIGSFQALKHPTVDIYVGMEQTRSLVFSAASAIGGNRLDREAEVACRMAKTMASESFVYAADRSVQFRGGFGFTWECDSTLFIRRAQWAQQQFGDAMHHRARLATLLLG